MTNSPMTTPPQADAPLPPDFFKLFTAKPCNICGKGRNYSVDGQLQVVCFDCANPDLSAHRRSLSPSGGAPTLTREEAQSAVFLLSHETTCSAIGSGLRGCDCVRKKAADVLYASLAGPSGIASPQGERANDLGPAIPPEGGFVDPVASWTDEQVNYAYTEILHAVNTGSGGRVGNQIIPVTTVGKLRAAFARIFGVMLTRALPASVPGAPTSEGPEQAWMREQAIEGAVKLRRWHELECDDDQCRCLLRATAIENLALLPSLGGDGSEDTKGCSPGPWFIREKGDDLFVSSQRPDGKPYANEILGDENYPEKRADAEFIVRAFNAVRGAGQTTEGGR